MKIVQIKFLLLCSILLLQGCMTPYEAGSGSTTKQALISRDNERFNSYKPKLASLEDKLLVRAWSGGSGPVPRRYFTDTRTVSDADRPALEVYYQYQRETLDDFEDAVRKRYYHYLPLLPAVRTGQLGLLLSLYKGEISYGEYHTKHVEFLNRQAAAMREKDLELLMGLAGNSLGAAATNYYSYLQSLQFVNSSFQPTIVVPLTINLYQQAPLNIIPPPMPGIIRR